MGYSSTNIHFDYDGHYAKSGDDYEWIPNDSRLYVISFKTSSLDEITYSFLKERICNKETIDQCKKRLNPSYIPIVVEPKRQSYILDDENMFVYLTSVDKEGRRSILHVKIIKEIEINNLSALTLFTHIEEVERYLAGAERVENVVNGEADKGGIGLDNMDIMDNEGDMDKSMGVRPICDYVDLPRVVKKNLVVTEWEDGLGIELFQEFLSKNNVKDIIDRASQKKNCFGISIANSGSG
ncbi:hypothetical protein N665_0655s0006 [Sinapis alba]|nr:hypothetical protein N665_0655s0006 [Sinapis alba]